MFQELVDQYHRFFQRIPLTIVGISVILIIGVLLFLKGCDKHEIKKIDNQSLQGSEKTAVIVNTDTDTVETITGRTKSGQVSKRSNAVDPGSQTVTTTTGARDIRISIDSKGNVKVTSRTKGYCLDVGAVVGYKRLGLDAQWYFYKNFGPTVGLTTDFHGRDWQVHGGLAYTLPWRLVNNTCVVLTYDTAKRINILYKIKFGRN